MGITDHLAGIRARIDEAARRSTARRDERHEGGQAGGRITLVGASKGQSIATIRAALAAGLHDFGEHYVQEALPKITAVGPGATWHFIGRIQSNKTRDIATHFAWAQTVTSARIARRLDDQRPHFGPPLQVCIQVAAEDAPGRDGCPRAEVVELAAVIAGLPRLTLRGLMLLPAEGLAPEAERLEYRATAELFDELNRRGHRLDTLSMGMSGDFERAIEEGSTMVRVGTALFGPRGK